ncbi:MAG: long-chain fatty acid--CoA ligase, partial [Bacilli bacterium]|nr:long-chain fatty acid--CoA ligase [Bacilli bacterium]
AKLDEKQLDEYCRKHLAAFKVPRIYEFREELPKSVIGKVLKRQLVEEAIEQMKKEATS